MVSTRRGVVVAPHPDDEVLGASALLRASTATVVYVTDGVPPHAADASLARTRLAEARVAHRILEADVADVVELGFADQGVTGAVDAVAAALGALVAEHPDVDVYVPAYQRGHPDHDAVHVAAQVARSLTPASVGWHVYALYGFDDDGVDGFAALGAEHTVGRRRAGGVPADLERKARAVRAFTSQLPDESVLAGWLRDPVPEQYAALPTVGDGLPPRRCFYDEVFGFRQFGIDPDDVTARLTAALARAGLVPG
jgi:LmbE family N-acetylglucosaminyl deacetylase